METTTKRTISIAPHHQGTQVQIRPNQTILTTPTIIAMLCITLLLSGCATTPAIIPGGGEFWATHAGSKKRPRRHHGVDYRAPPGATVIAAADGQVWRSDKNRPPVTAHAQRLGYGRTVTILHDIPGNRLLTKYLHLNKVYVDTLQYVKKGQPIGTVAGTIAEKTLWNTIPHVHFEVWVGAQVVNPASKIGSCHNAENPTSNPNKPLVYPLLC